MAQQGIESHPRYIELSRSLIKGSNGQPREETIKGFVILEQQSRAQTIRDKTHTDQIPHKSLVRINRTNLTGG